MTKIIHAFNMEVAKERAHTVGGLDVNSCRLYSRGGMLNAYEFDTLEEKAIRTKDLRIARERALRNNSW